MWMLTEKWTKQCNVFSICYSLLGGGGKLPNANYQNYQLPNHFLGGGVIYQKCKLPKLPTTNSFLGGGVNYQMFFNEYEPNLKKKIFCFWRVVIILNFESPGLCMFFQGRVWNTLSQMFESTLE